MIGAIGAPTETIGEGEASGAKWNWEAEAALRGAYDDNVYLQSEGPLDNRSSWITSVLPKARLGLQTENGFAGSLSYAPDLQIYHDEPDENHATHALGLELGVKKERVQANFTSKLTWIDGEDEGVVFIDASGRGGVPAIGGIPIRNRRDAAIVGQDATVTYSWDPWFLRAAGHLYLHDFRTDHRATPGYLNYVDRTDVNGGLDLGRKVMENASVFVGYRFGHQKQAKLLGLPLEYSNDYHRVLAGFEGKISDWLKLSFALGPDFRNFGGNVAAGFNDSHTRLYYLGQATITPGARDKFVVLARQYEMPSFGGRGVYQDLTWQAAWQHEFSKKFRGELFFRAYNGDFEPARRNDWIYTLSATMAYQIADNWNTEISYSYDVADSTVSGTDEREFKRNIVAAGVKYRF